VHTSACTTRRSVGSRGSGKEGDVAKQDLTPDFSMTECRAERAGLACAKGKLDCEDCRVEAERYIDRIKKMLEYWKCDAYGW
jgi:hypothetical protein